VSAKKKTTPTDERIRDEYSAALGASLRARRKSMHLTLADVAERSGLSSPFISQLERGHTRPSMRSLQQLAVALETTATDLFDDGREVPDESRRIDHFRAVDRRGLSQSEGEPDVHVLPITRGATQFQAFDWIDGPRAWEGPFVHRNDEVMYVLEGAIEVELDGALHVVETGDSISYSGGVQHRWRATTARSRVIVIVASEHLGRTDPPATAD
jgi:transcriptional regulator with XRE-family HTH domain